MLSPRLAIVLGLVLGFCGPASGELFVSSFSSNRVSRFSETNGAPIGSGVFVTNNSGGLNLPHGLAFGPDGNLYVASAGNDAVLRYNGTNGAFLNAFIPPTNGVIDYPVGLEFRPDGFLYVSSQLNHSVVRFDATNGAFAGVFVTNGSGGLNGPSGMAWGPDGHLYVVGRFGNHVLKYDGTNGAFLGTVIASNGPLSQPFGCKFGPDGLLYVASGNGNKIVRVDVASGGGPADFIPSGSGGLSLPIDLNFGPTGDLYVSSFGNNKVARFNAATGASSNDFVTASGSGLRGPNFMTFRAARTYGTNIPGIGPLGPIEQRHFGLAFTEGPAVDANGNVYFSDVDAARICKSDTRGLLSTFFPNDSACNGLMLDQRGRLIACQRDLKRIIAIDIASTNVTALATNFAGSQFIGPNDLVVDSSGGVYFTDPDYSVSASTYSQSFYYVSAAGVVSRMGVNLARPNGIILSPDERTLYLVSSGVPRLMTYAVLSPGVLGPPVTNAIPQTGDGMTIDTAGNLYLCQPPANHILVRSPAGLALGTIPVPEIPANCTFGGKDLKTLFIAARTSIYTCRMAIAGHRFAMNPPSYPDFQRVFFGSTNAPGSGRAADPDGDGLSNEFEYLIRTHPLMGSDSWQVSIQRTSGVARISFPQIAGRGFELQAAAELPGSNSWTQLAVPGNPPAITTSNRTTTIADPMALGTNRFYRVRIFEP